MDQNEGFSSDPQEGQVASSHEHEQRVLRGNVPGGERGHSDHRAPEPPNPEDRHDPGGLERYGQGAAGRDERYPDHPELIANTDPLIPLGAVGYSRQEVSLHVGPLPEPVTLARYGEVDPSFPERIVRMAEMQVEAQVHAQRKAIDATAFATRAGAWVAVGLAIASVIGFVALVALGTGFLAFAALIPAILGGVAQVVSAIGGARRGGDDQQR